MRELKAKNQPGADFRLFSHVVAECGNQSLLPKPA